MSSKSSSEVRILCLFFDTAHRQEFQPRTVVLNAEDFINMRVSRFLGLAEHQHRFECQNGRCSRCPGAILVKCAWLVKIPVATGEERARQIIELEHDPSEGLEFMLPQGYMSQYIRTPEEQDTIRVIFECTFDKEDRRFNNLTALTHSKHARSPSDEAAASDETASKRPKFGPIAVPKGLRVVANTNEADPINILPPSQTLFPFYIHHTGIVIVDKTRFIAVIDGLLDKHVSCIIALAKGTGKSAKDVWAPRNQQDPEEA
ncbi:hypothetical protein B0H11DRAFT_2112325 [Mycena galericulata]|nr:hypothetical protein B0H11DRAFT_2112325 [Mycena galericulata]